MADRNSRLNVDLTATDNASNKIDRVADKADALERDAVNVEVDADTSGLSGKLEGVTEKLSGLGGHAGGLGDALGQIASPGGAVAAIGAGLFVAAEQAANTAIAADDLARLTGDSVEQASRLNAVWSSAGLETTDLQDVLLQMQGVLAGDADLARELGVNLNDGKGIGERFVEVVGAVGDKFTDSGERAVVMSKLFGEEGVRQVNTVTGAVGELDAAIAAVPENRVITEAEVRQAREYRENMTELKATLASFANELGQHAIPQMAELIGQFNDLFQIAEQLHLLDLAATIREWDFITPTGQIRQMQNTLMGTKVPLTELGDTADEVATKLREMGATEEEIARAFDTASAEERDALGLVESALGNVSTKLRDAEDAAREHIDALGEERDAAVDVTGATEGFTEAISDSIDAQLDALEAQEAVTNARRAAADATFAVHEAERQFAEQVATTTEQLGLSEAEMREQGITLLDLRAGIEATATEAAAVADAEVRVAQETATANGEVLDAKEAQRIWTESMIASANSLDGPLRQAVLDYIARVNGIPQEHITTVAPYLDDGMLTEVEARLAELARDRLAVVRVRLAGARLTNDGTVDYGGGEFAQVAGAEGGIINRPTVLLAGEAGPEALVPLHRSPGNGPLPQNIGGVPLAFHVYDRGGVEHIVQAKIDQHDAELLAALRAG